MMQEKKFNRWFNAFILIGMTVATVFATASELKTGDSGKFLILLAAFSSIMGILGVLCSANASIFTFLFGFFEVSTYSVLCFINWRATGVGLGNALIFSLYFLPMQFVGFYQWRHHGAEADKPVQARRQTPAQRWLFTGLLLVGTAVAYYMLSLADKSAAGQFLRVALVMDAASMVCNILGQMLLSTAYMEQWIFWIGVNVFSVIMWSITLSKGGDGTSYALILVIKYAFYLLNSLNGLRIWLGLSKKAQCLEY